MFLTSGGLDGDETFLGADNQSSLSDEGLDLSQRISESLFMGPDIETDAELVAGGFIDTCAIIECLYLHPETAGSARMSSTFHCKL